MTLIRPDFKNRFKLDKENLYWHKHKSHDKKIGQQKYGLSLRKMAVLLCIVPGILISQVSPASAADSSHIYYNGRTAPSQGKTGPKGNIVGGTTVLLVGTKASVSISTITPNGAVLHTGSTAGAGPTSITHKVVINGISGCVWLEHGGRPSPRDLKCSNIRRS